MILLCLSLLIGYAGPLLTIAGNHPLLAIENRLYCIALLFLIWLLKFIFIDTNPAKIAEETNPIPPLTLKKIAHLQGKFAGAIEFLKKTIINKHGKNVNLANLPWYLFIGPSGAGKTTLLANSNVSFILSKQFKSDSISALPPSDSCDWWVTRDLVLVDIPGNYLLSKSKITPENTPAYHAIWRHLLGLIKQFHGKKPLQGIIIALPLPDFIKEQKNTQKNQLTYNLRKRITDLLNHFGNDLPIHIVITKCDLLPGFVEFFSECSTDETAQTWGVTLPTPTESESTIDVFTQRFNALIKRLNKQLIARLHQERNAEARPYIKDFPLHIERLKESTIQFLKALMLPNLNIQSVYLTSGNQANSDQQPGFVSTTASQALQIMSAPTMPSKAYFVRQLILHNLLATPTNHDHRHVEHAVWKRRITYGTATLSIIMAAIFLGWDFEHSIKKTYSIKHDLTQYQVDIQQGNIRGDHLLHALPLLNALQRAATHPLDRLLLPFYSKKSQQTADVVYHQALHTIVLPEIRSYFENYLHSIDNKNPEQVYAVLKAYLMLNDVKKFDARYITQLSKPFIPLSKDNIALTQLNNHIQTALTQPHTPIPLDMTLIAEVRKRLHDLPTNTLALVLLKDIGNNSIDSALGLGTNLGNPPVFLSGSVASQVQTMFTATAFPKIINDDLNRIAIDTLQGNWVLGMNPDEVSQGDIDALASELRTQYIANYVDIWESLLANLQLNTPHTLAENDAMIATLTSNTSPLLQLLDTVKRNTAFEPIMAASPKLQSLADLLANANNNENTGLYAIFVSLKQLHMYLQSMLTTPQGVLQATTTRFQNPTNDPLTEIRTLAEQSPEPMKSWLNTIAAQTWHLMVQEAGSEIDTSWQKTIMPVYHASIANRYPFNQTAMQEVELNQFSQFLGQHGLLSRFYNQYLSAFAQETSEQLTWRTVENETLPFSEALLNAYKQVNSLQRAFFPNGDNKLYVQFTLQPITLDPAMKSFTLNINGQEINYPKTPASTPRLLTWPGNTNSHATTYHFVSASNQLNAATMSGDWGWFRLVSKATKNVNTRKELVLSFENDGHAARYLLFTQGSLNPFLPLNLTRFELPEQLS